MTALETSGDGAASDGGDTVQAISREMRGWGGGRCP